MQITIHNVLKRGWLALVAVVVLALGVGHAQITPAADAFTNSAASGTNYGSSGLLDVVGTSQYTYIQFNLSSIPSGTGISEATLKLYVNSVSTGGTFNVDYANGTWLESTIDYINQPAVGGMIALSPSLTSASKNQYILIPVTSAVEAWLNGSQPNDGIVLVANGALNVSFDSKENTTTSHPPELDIVFTTGATTGGGLVLSASGTTLGLLSSCAANQVLGWNGSAWACSSAGTGTITQVTAGTDLTGGGNSGNVTLGLNTNLVPQLGTPNTFTANQTVNGNVITNSQLVSNAPQGTPPLQVTSTTLVPNLNVGLLGGLSASSFANLSASNTFNSIQSISATSTLPALTSSNFSGADGVDGLTSGTPTSGNNFGVMGTNSSGVAGSGAGVFGMEGLNKSSTGSGRGGAGVWGDSGNNGSFGVFATGDNVDAIAGMNNSATNPTLYLSNFYNSSGAGGPVMFAQGAFGSCQINGVGSLLCTGSKSAIVPVDGGNRTVALYAVESPENWFEDVGSGQLSAGSTTVNLEPVFAQTINAEIEYHVFLTPKGECEGLYVTNETATGFEVHELHSGHSNISFDYRIMARRKGYESIRLADMTASMPKTVTESPKP